MLQARLSLGLPKDDGELFCTLRDAVIGEGAVLEGPYGPRLGVYVDYAASGRAVTFIEDYLRDEVLPYYANTHTEASGYGARTTELREEARRSIAAAVGAGPDDVVVFCGSGSSAAIDKLIAVLNLRIPHELEARYRLSERIPLEERPVVFVGPHEHHSNELAWRESIATVVQIPENARGELDLAALEAALPRYAERSLKIGSFTAASNVTGQIADVVRTTRLLHAHGALAFWDYAAAGPYLPLAMNPPGGVECMLDAMFLSPHKLVGGPGTPGVLVAKRRLFKNRVPTLPGGGTISYVTAEVQRYVTDIAAREEGGTPAIVEAIRAGRAFELRDAVGLRAAALRERSLTRRALATLGENPAIVVLGHPTLPRIPIVSFLIRHGNGFLHHHFVVRLLSDLFGIQARSGCSCAGPYGHALLGVGREASHAFDELASAGYLGIKPGWARITLSYLVSEEAFAYVLRAIDFVARHGFRFLPDYAFDARSGAFRHAESRVRGAPAERGVPGQTPPESRPVPRSRRRAPSLPESILPQYLELAHALLAERRPSCRARASSLPPQFERWRWFPLPDEIDGEKRGVPELCAKALAPRQSFPDSRGTPKLSSQR